MVEEIPARTGKMGQFYLGFQTFTPCRAVNKTKNLYTHFAHSRDTYARSLYWTQTFMRLAARCFDRLLATAMLAHRNLRFCLFQRRCYVNTYATQPLQASCSALHWQHDRLGGTPTPDLDFYNFIFLKSEFWCCKNLQKQQIKLQIQQNTEKW